MQLLNGATVTSNSSLILPTTLTEDVPTNATAEIYFTSNGMIEIESASVMASNSIVL